MKTLVKAFWNNPVIFLGVLVTANTILAGEGTISTAVAGAITVLLTGLQHQFSSPANPQ